MKNYKKVLGKALVAYAMVALLLSSLTTSTFAANAAIKLTCGSDSNGEITEWILKGDADRDKDVDADDETAIINHDLGTPTITDAMALRAADLDEDGSADSRDHSLIGNLLNGSIALPDGNGYFSFSVVDTPAPGYKLKSVNIKAGNNADVVLTVAHPANNGYELSIDANGKATVTGKSLATNQVDFTHELISSVITLDAISDANGQISKWILMGDADRDKDVDGNDEIAVINHDLSKTPITDELALKAADLDEDGSADSRDYSLIASILYGKETLPNKYFTYSVVDTPAPGYKLKSVSITAGNSTVVLTPASLTNGNYKLSIDDNGVITLSGTSLSNNKVVFVHELISAVITINPTSDDNGEVTEWLVKGDYDRDKDVDGNDEIALIANDLNLRKANDEMITKSGDIDLDGYVDSRDYNLVDALLEGRTVLKNELFTFEAVDKPADGYKLKNVTIKTSDGAEVVLTPYNTNNNNYILSIDNKGVATVSGHSLLVNDIHFIHEAASNQTPVSPDTGVTSNIWLYIGLLAGATVILGYVIYSKKHQGKSI